MRGTRGTLNLVRSNGIGLLALFIVLGGSAYAASQGSGPGRNTIGAQQIKANAVGSSEVRANAVGAAEIRDSSVGGSDLSDGAVGSAALADGSVAPADLGFQVPQRGDVGLRGTTVTEPLNLSGGFNSPFSPVATQEFSLANQSAVLIQGQVSMTDNKDGNPSQVELRIVHNGHVEAVFKDTVADAGSRTVPVSVQCNDVRPGDNAISIEMRGTDGASNVVLGTRTLQILQFGPIFNPP